MGNGEWGMGNNAVRLTKLLATRNSPLAISLYFTFNYTNLKPPYCISHNIIL